MDRSTLVHRIGQFAGALMIFVGVMLLASTFFRVGVNSPLSPERYIANGLFGVGAILSGMSGFVRRKGSKFHVALAWLGTLMMIAWFFVLVTSS